ncbi:unnamed protein product [Pedinophyceae sp. YPF-701]|nr:unnamed protein product [Pedinophyceae sp. YPF-701]
MFVGGGGQGGPLSCNRAFFMALIFVFLLLSTLNEMPANKNKRLDVRPPGADGQSEERRGPDKETVMQKMVYDLSLDNESLDRENRQLKTWLLALRRNTRSQPACRLDEDSEALLAKFEALLAGGEDAQAGKADDAGAKTAGDAAEGSTAGRSTATGGDAQDGAADTGDRGV